MKAHEITIKDVTYVLSYKSASERACVGCDVVTYEDCLALNSSCKDHLIWKKKKEPEMLKAEPVKQVAIEWAEVYTRAHESLAKDGFILERNTVKVIAYCALYGGNRLPQVMRDKGLDLMTTGAIIEALNEAIKGE